MPIFEKRCDKCGRITEEIILNNADKKKQKKSEIKCNKNNCDGIMQDVEFSKSTFQLKGKWFKNGGY